jgi:hypothetical protein
MTVTQHKTSDIHICSRPDWEWPTLGWSKWEECSKESAADYERLGVYNGLVYEARGLYSTTTASTALDDTQKILRRMWSEGGGNQTITNPTENEVYGLVHGLSVLANSAIDSEPPALPASVVVKRRCSVCGETQFQTPSGKC